MMEKFPCCQNTISLRIPLSAQSVFMWESNHLFKVHHLWPVVFSHFFLNENGYKYKIGWIYPVGTQTVFKKKKKDNLDQGGVQPAAAHGPRQLRMRPKKKIWQCLFSGPFIQVQPLQAKAAYLHTVSVKGLKCTRARCTWIHHKHWQARHLAVVGCQPLP